MKLSRLVGLSLALASVSSFAAIDSEKMAQLKEGRAFFDSKPVEFFVGQPYKPNAIKKEVEVNIAFRRLEQENAVGNMVVVHGIGENMQKLVELSYDFFKLGYNVYPIDMRGHGLSTRLDDSFKGAHVHDFDNYVEDIKTLVDNYLPASDHNVIWGHSMGGGIATRFVQTYPGIFQKAILNAPMMDFDTQGFPKWIAEALSVGASIFDSTSYALGQKDPTDPALDTFEANTGTSDETRWVDYQDVKMTSDIYLLGGASWGWAAQSIQATNKMLKEKEMNKVEIPVLLFQAGDDSWVLPEKQVEFCNYVSTCEFHLF